MAAGLDPGLAPALVVAGLLTLGGLVPLPRAVICIGAGAALGWPAVLPAMLGSACGATLGFGLARVALSGIVRRAAARRPRLDAVMRAIEAEGWRVIGLLRLASPIPGPAVNLACGASRLGFGEYLAATVLGLLPQTLLFIHLGRTGGAALAGGSPWSLDGLTAALGIALTALALWRLTVAAKRQARRIMTAAADCATPVP